MNLSDVTLRKRFDQLFPPGRGGNDSIDKRAQLQPSTVDLRLGNVFYRLRPNTILPASASRVDPMADSSDDYFERIEVPNGTPFVMTPGASGFVLGTTLEYVAVPNDLVGLVDGRSSYGRWGLRIHSTAGLIDAGFCGTITLEISLDSNFELVLYPGDRVCQIRFEMLDTPCALPYGHEERSSKYMHQEGTTPSRLNEDRYSHE
jgi:dCTP deaminase